VDAVVSVRGLRKRFGDLVVLDGVDLEAARGEVVALVGPSGSGKSTLLRCVNGLECHDEGTLTVLGTDVPAGDPGPLRRDAFWRPLRRRIGVVFQAFHLYPHLSARDNVALAPRTVLRLAPADAAERADALLARVGLSDKADVLPRALSGGQRQRVAIARALAMEPDILLFDEPTSALDPETVGEVLSVIRDLAAEHRRTILIVTHEIPFAREAADRAAFLDGGRIVECGPAARVLGSPEHPRTREFLDRLLRPGGRRP
jgi:ABC-type polar amino acid transport system ATPase subunit